jgi:hypothetical protein
MKYDDIDNGKLNDLNGKCGLSILTGEWGLAGLAGKISVAKLTAEYQRFFVLHALSGRR